MRNLLKTFFFPPLLAFLALLVLQWIPYTGIFLMFVGAAFWAGLLLHGALFGLTIDALRGVVPRVLLVVPIAAYGAYYTIYLQQG
jgi:hypothetical protein